MFISPKLALFLNDKGLRIAFVYDIEIDTKPSQLNEPFYEGSVQRLYDHPNDPSFMITQTTDRGSVFDVGALFEIPGHDVNRAVFRHLLYSRMGDVAIWQGVHQSIESDTELDAHYKSEILTGALEEFRSMGALTHHVGMLDAETGEMVAGGLPENPSAYNVVRKFKILKPTKLELPDGASLFDYSGYPKQNGYVVPLEYIVRFGITSASSVYQKYLGLDAAAKAKFEAELGVSKPLEAWQYLEKPIADYTTKFEPADRMLTRQEAFATSGLSGHLFRRGTKMAVLGAWAVRSMIAPLQLKMWDIKWEFAHDGDDLVYVDTIDTDSFRATLEIEHGDRTFVNHYNKQAMRDYYRVFHGDWIKAIAKAKQQADIEGVAFTELLAKEYPEHPEAAADFIEIQRQKMTAICDHLLGRSEADAAAKQLQELGVAEISFYEAAGKLDAFAELNAIS